MTCVCFYSSRAHDIIIESENTKYIHECCLKLAESRNGFSLLYFNNSKQRATRAFTLDTLFNFSKYFG